MYEAAINLSTRQRWTELWGGDQLKYPATINQQQQNEQAHVHIWWHLLWMRQLMTAGMHSWLANRRRQRTSHSRSEYFRFIALVVQGRSHLLEWFICCCSCCCCSCWWCWWCFCCCCCCCCFCCCICCSSCCCCYCCCCCCCCCFLCTSEYLFIVVFS